MVLIFVNTNKRSLKAKKSNSSSSGHFSRIVCLESYSICNETETESEVLVRLMTNLKKQRQKKKD